ncbi:hypothetical protein BO70DRAFT_360945 [Aspergillus heteromorphus CBS 117.55]|uniref:Uncharacterized protein n=1 Tax=Aspergillus heteromorphus CBS 117.55 TaxID=1448321 RepID=A0A317WPB4_9EURO|nr:uncharacterized protein BO70DRAFT_360945 [Aspergillus heteromorphus CBS 117.55]PWY86130.1 hypothetical protein BO70DRAFT_360945 [Aspergillus heteromorphus CBS 117.55]
MVPLTPSTVSSSSSIRPLPRDKSLSLSPSPPLPRKSSAETSLLPVNSAPPSNPPSPG